MVASAPLPFYSVTRLGAGELARAPDLLGRIRSGDENALVVHGFLDVVQAVEVLARARAARPAERRFAHEFEAYSIGPCLDQAERGLGVYLDEAEPFALRIRDWFAGGLDFERRLFAILGAIAGGREVARARSADGRPYALATLRRLPPGGCIPPHLENEQLARPPYRELAAQLEPSTLVSFYLTLAAAESGGEVSVHDFRWSEIERAPRRDGHAELAPLLGDRERVVLAAGAGDLLLFDGGRFVHQVVPVGGGRERFTLGGFLGFSRDGQKVLVWA